MFYKIKTMRRKRRQTEKDSERKIVGEILKIKIPETAQEPAALYSVSDIAQEYTKFLQHHLPAPEEKPERAAQLSHVEQILTNREQFLRNILAPVGVLESFIQYITSALH